MCVYVICFGSGKIYSKFIIEGEEKRSGEERDLDQVTVKEDSIYNILISKEECSKVMFKSYVLTTKN
jgi:hypothetical protein